MSENFQPLFVGGSGRSGTTIVVNLLNKHSEVHSSLPREIKYLTSRFGLIDLIYGRPISLEENSAAKRNNLGARAFPIFGKSKIDLFIKNMHGPWWSEVGKKGNTRGLAQGITEQTLDLALEDFVNKFKFKPLETARNIYFQLSGAQIKHPNVKYFADSTPVNIMQANYLYQLFPDARFLNMVRDGRDVAFSVAAERWGPSDPYEALDWWANRLLKAERALISIPQNQKVTLRLEDLVVRERESSLNLILEFLGINLEGKVKDFFDEELTQEKLNQGQWQSKLANPTKFEKKYLKILDQLKDKGVVVERFY